MIWILLYNLKLVMIGVYIIRNTIFFAAICWRSPGIFTRTSRHLGHTVSMWLLAWQLSHSSIPNTTYLKHSKGKSFINESKSWFIMIWGVVLLDIRSCPPWTCTQFSRVKESSFYKRPTFYSQVRGDQGFWWGSSCIKTGRWGVKLSIWPFY